MQGKPKWLTAADLITINKGLVTNHFVRDVNLLENAVAAPQQLHLYGGNDVDLIILAVRLLEAVARAHAFEDGNKRVAFIAAANFLQLNGCIFALPDDEIRAKWVEQLVTRELSADNVAKLLRPFVIVTGAPAARDG